MLESRIFEIQQERALQHSRMESAFEKYSNSNFEKYRDELEKITKEMSMQVVGETGLISLVIF